jgi:uncharacterized protein (TIGR00304 family)
VWDLVSAGLALVLAGFGVVAVALLRSENTGHSEVKGGGVIMVGPIPLVFASDSKWASVAIVLAIALMLLALLFYVL